MPALHNRERDTSDYRDQKDDDREISLGTGTILGIFFALALVCAVFFGLGYSMGRKSAAQSPATASSSAPPSNATFSSFKPPAGSLAPPTAKKTAPAPPPSDPDGEIVTTPVSSSEETAAPSAPRRDAAAPEAAAPIVRQTPLSGQSAQLQSQNPGQTHPQSAAMPAISATGTAIVQVAAVSHQEDADLLVAALKKRGYNVFIRQEPQDHLLHVQLGPFASKKDAEAMRQHLLADGYNAIVK
jgi:cell division septation protein DedD